MSKQNDSDIKFNFINVHELPTDETMHLVLAKHNPEMLGGMFFQKKGLRGKLRQGQRGKMRHLTPFKINGGNSTNSYRKTKHAR